MITDTHWEGKNRPRAIGPYEASQREKVIEVRRRLMCVPSPPVKLPRPRPLSPYHPERLAERLAVTLAMPEHLDPPQDEIPYVPGEAPTPAATSAEIIKEVCLKHGVKVTEIVSPIRSKHIIPARHEAMYRVREERHLSWAQLARLFNRDHTSVIHGWRKHKALLTAQEANA